MSVSHLALVQNDNPRVLVILLLHLVFGIYARPLHLKTQKQMANYFQLVGL